MRLTCPNFLNRWDIGSHLTVLIGEEKPDANHQQKQAPFDDSLYKANHKQDHHGANQPSDGRMGEESLNGFLIVSEKLTDSLRSIVFPSLLNT